jgi:hypothetical protein
LPSMTTSQPVKTLEAVNQSDLLGERIVRVIFYFLLAVCLYPVFSLDYLVSHDGASHVYNAGLIRQLLSFDSMADDFMDLKSFPEPNWIGHFILVILQFFVSPQISDKIFLGAYVVLFPVFFRHLLRKVNSESTVLSLLSFPFVYSLFFFLGVYNFLAGITILFLALASLLPRIASGKKITARIFIYSMLLYFSHLLALGVFILVTGIALLFQYFVLNGDERKRFLKKIIPAVIAFAPALILSSIFFIGTFNLPSKVSAVTMHEMLTFLWQVRFIITLTFSPENIYAFVIFGLIVLVLITWIVTMIIRKNQVQKKFYQKFPFWLICTLLMLAFFFLIPDEAATGGVVKFRFLFLFYLFLIAMLSVVKLPTVVNAIFIVTVAGWTVIKLNYLFPMMRELNNEAVELIHATNKITPNSILLPLNYSTNWLHENFSNYAGYRDKILVLDNYEANTPHFPLKWKDYMSPNKLIGEFMGYGPLCADMDRFEKQTGRMIDYVLVWRPGVFNDTCAKSINAILAQRYTLITDESGARLYKRHR